MGTFSKDKGAAFSGFSGKLLFEGRPVEGAKLTCTWHVFNDKGEDSATTDKNGRFVFGFVEVAFRTPPLAPYDFMSKQKIFVTFNNEEYRIWLGGKAEKEAYKEFNGESKNLVCELTEDARRVDLAHGFVGTNCRWEISRGA